MGKPKKLIGGLTSEMLYEALRTCANLADVRREVILNHDNNKWWPITVKDWRLRMVIAGWSTRVSYNMIETYKRVVSDANRVGYENLCKMSQAELFDLVGSLGLFDSRRTYLESISAFIATLGKSTKSVLDIPNDELIVLIANNVKGASFKVSQCAALYAKGYHCGIFPVDSGMKDMLGPCVGLQLPSGPIAHEVMRYHFERAINSMSDTLRLFAQQSGYDGLNIPIEQAPMWWAHLVLIYFKRLYCNKRNPQNCPLRANPVIGKFMGTMCARDDPQLGGFRHIILEGPDMVGKTTVAEKLGEMGYVVSHSSYNPDHHDIFGYYRSIIENTTLPVVFDRTFISEMTYGVVLRGSSRLSEQEFVDLLRLLSNKGYVLFYFKENLDTIHQRLVQSGHEEHRQSLSKLEDLLSEYDKCIAKVSEYLPVFQIIPTQTSQEKIMELIHQVIENGTRPFHSRERIS